MNKLALQNSMTTEYNRLAYTHSYMHAFNYKGLVMVAYTDASELMTITKLDVASRNGGYSLRFKPTVKQKEYLMTKETFVLCSVAYFNEVVQNSKYNKGEIAEKLITEHFNQKWTKDSVPFTVDGDLTVNKVAYQIKYENATYCTESSLKNLQV